MEKIEKDSRLILEVESHQILFNRALPEYKIRPKKDHAWQEVAAVINLTVDECKKRWKGLRDTFSSYYKADKNVPSGSGATPSCKWVHFNSLQFLVPFVAVPQ